MPTAPLRPCSGSPTCPELTTGGPCPAHARPRPAPPTDHRWYHLARWKHPTWGLRAQTLRLYPLCVDCHARGVVEPSTDADHEIPHRGDAALFWNLENLRGRCRPCHSRKTREGK